MTDQPIMEAPVTPARVVDRGARIWLIILSVAVGMQALVLLAGGVYIVASISGMGLFGMPDDEAFLQTQRVGTEISTLAQDGDVDGYMALYRDDDASVDRDKMRSDFEAVLASLESTDSVPEYSVDTAVEYTDDATGEKVVSMSLSAFDYTTGEPRGRRMEVWVLYEELPDVVLTGDGDRDLVDPKMIF